MEGCFLRLRNTRVFVGNVIGTNRHPLATASLTAGSLAARIAVSSRSMKISANMGQPPYWPDVYSAGGVWGLKLSLNLLGDFLEISVLGCCPARRRIRNTGHTEVRCVGVEPLWGYFSLLQLRSTVSLVRHCLSNSANAGK